MVIQKDTGAGALDSLLKTERLEFDGRGGFMQPSTGRKVMLHGINVAGSAKLPADPWQPSYTNPSKCGFYTEGDNVSFVGRPFPLNEAYEHLTRIKLCGYNTIRYLFTWEAIEHEGPGIYDEDYVEYVVELLKKIDEVGGLYVFLDPHQDVWSRYSGGSGAPLWTLYAAGLDPRNFDATGAAKLHCESSDPANYTRMVWSTNYNRLATETMFTMFFSGRMFLPQAIIDDQNIEDYLQDHFIEAVAFLVQSIKDNAPELFDTCFIGTETINEPNCGMYGFESIDDYPAAQTLKLDESPTPIQALSLGMGRRENLDVFKLSVFGPRKKGKLTIDPKGAKAWVADDSMDKHYGFHRSPSWKLGECVFAQHGIWDPITGKSLKPHYFQHDPANGQELTRDTFINRNFVKFWAKFKTRLRKVDKDMVIILEPPVLEVPPRLKDSNLIDARTAVSVHYYDGMTLVFCSWNRKMNINTLGVMRHRHSNPIFDIVLGEGNIRKSFRTQFREMKEECVQNMGKSVPILMTETGAPFNMDGKKAFIDGDYNSQESALDAIGFALDGNAFNHTMWCYNPENNHKWGDDWNLEDFSVFSKDDEPKAFSMKDSSGKYTEWLTYVSTASSSSSNSGTVTERKSEETLLVKSDRVAKSLIDGIRAEHAVIRPYPLLVNGEVTTATLDLAKGTYHLEIDTSKTIRGRGRSPTVVYIPDWFKDCKLRASIGTPTIKVGELLHVVEWQHPAHTGIITLDVESSAKSARHRSLLDRLLDWVCAIC